ncbi:MAG TPA: Asp-tRNA(Asn)/Glu-tRNA(Gln) amidotransferase subunit GatC [Trueperaceae bacterium]
MSISDEELAHLANLARLELSPGEALTIRSDLNSLLGYFEQLRNLDTDGVEELTRPVATRNVFRDDEARPGLAPEEVLALAVDTEDGFVKVPRTVDTGE